MIYLIPNDNNNKWQLKLSQLTLDVVWLVARLAVRVAGDGLLAVLGGAAQLGAVQAVVTSHSVAHPAQRQYWLVESTGCGELNKMLCHSFHYLLYGFTVIVDVIIGLLLFRSVVKLHRVPGDHTIWYLYNLLTQDTIGLTSKKMASCAPLGNLIKVLCTFYAFMLCQCLKVSSEAY